MKKQRNVIMKTKRLELFKEKNNMDKDLLIWLYEQKDDIDAHLYGIGSYDRAEGTYRQELFAQLNLLDKIIRHIRKG